MSREQKTENNCRPWSAIKALWIALKMAQQHLYYVQYCLFDTAQKLVQDLDRWRIDDLGDPTQEQEEKSFLFCAYLWGQDKRGQSEQHELERGKEGNSRRKGSLHAKTQKGKRDFEGFEGRLHKPFRESFVGVEASGAPFTHTINGVAWLRFREGRIRDGEKSREIMASAPSFYSWFYCCLLGQDAYLSISDRRIGSRAQPFFIPFDWRKPLKIEKRSKGLRHFRT